MSRDPYQRERARTAMGDDLMAGILVTLALLLIALGAVTFVYVRG